MIRKWKFQLKNGPETLTYTTSKNGMQWSISTWKDAPHHMPSGRCKLKQQWDPTTHTPVRMATIQDTDTTKCCWGCGATGAHPLPGGPQNGAAPQEDSWAASYTTKHALTICLSHHAPWHFPRGVENSCPHKKLHADVYSSFSHNCLNLEAKKMSSSRWRCKHTVACPDDRTVSALKINELSSH